MRTTVATICGKDDYFIEMLRIAQAYSAMGCVVHIRFTMFPDDKGNVAIHNKLHLRKIEICDIVHVVHYEDLDDTTRGEMVYARTLGKAITYAVPTLSYINSFKFKDDNIIEGPLKWVAYTSGYQISDAHNKIVAVERVVSSQNGVPS